VRASKKGFAVRPAKDNQRTVQLTKVRDKQLTAIALMLELMSRRARAELNASSGAIGRIVNRLGQEYPFVLVQPESVSACFHGEQYDSISRNEVIVLPPIEAGPLIPVVAFAYNWARSWPELRFRAGLFLENEGRNQAIGYRVESPEPAGKHEYPHAQPIKSFVKDGPRLPGPDWMPDSEPTLPLWGRCPADLVLALLIAFYGPEVVVRLEEAADTLKPFTEGYREWLSANRAKSYAFKAAGNRYVVVTSWAAEETVKHRARNERLKELTHLTAGEREALLGRGAELRVW
jgi:hypothetical protein